MEHIPSHLQSVWLFCTEIALAEKEDLGYTVDTNEETREQNMVADFATFRSYASFEQLRPRIHGNPSGRFELSFLGEEKKRTKKSIYAARSMQ